jgi:maltose O-acetyltransferase
MEKNGKRSLVAIVKYEIILWALWVLRNIPGQLGCYVRRAFFNTGEKVNIWENVIIDFPSRLVVGDNTSINRNCILNCGGGIEIGKNVLIGPNVVIYSQNHNFSDKSKPIKDQGYSYNKVVIEDNVWIGSGTTILPGAYIKKGSVIGASSVFGGKSDKHGIYYGDKAKRRNHY